MTKKYRGKWISEEGKCHFTRERCSEIEKDFFERKYLFDDIVYCTNCSVYQERRNGVANLLEDIRNNPFGPGLPPTVI